MQKTSILNSPKIRIEIILDSTLVEKWIFKILEQLMRTDFVVISYAINSGNVNGDSGNKISPIFRFHQLLDSWLYKGRFDYNKLIDCTDLIKGSRMIDGDKSKNPDRTDKYGHGITRQIIPEQDLLINFTCDNVPQELLINTKYGVLSFNIEGQRYPVNQEAAYGSLVACKPEIECQVTLSTQGLPEQVICGSSVSTFSNSIHINRDRVLGLAELLIPRAVEHFCLISRDATPGNDNAGLPNASPVKWEFGSTSSFMALINLFRIQFRSLKKRLLYLDNENWFLLYKWNDKEEALLGDYSNFLKLEAPKGYYWADPFTVIEEGKCYLFVEEYSYLAGRGHLVVMEQNLSGNFDKSKVILKKPYHLSYPFIFKHAGEYYMIPETKTEKAIQIYRCSDFPDKWEFVTNLMENVAAADSTVFFHNNKWWLFTSIDKLKNQAINFGELFLFYKDDLFSGNWTSHPQNPIVTAISQSRPAGRIFEKDGKIFRPSQDCSGGYGKAVNLNQITRLTETEYEEKNIKRIAPDWDRKLVGMHTFNYTNGFYILDACRLRKRFGR
jgi:hypothetical protein